MNQFEKDNKLLKKISEYLAMKKILMLTEEQQENIHEAITRKEKRVFRICFIFGIFLILFYILHCGILTYQFLLKVNSSSIQNKDHPQYTS